MTDPFSPEGPRIPGKVKTGKKRSKKMGRGVETTWHHLDKEQQDREHLDREEMDKEHLGSERLAEKGLGTTWQLCEQSEAHTSFHSLLHVLVLKEVRRGIFHTKNLLLFQRKPGQTLGCTSLPTTR